MRDYQRKALYASEKRAFPKTFATPEYTELDDVKAYTEAVAATDYWQALKGWQRFKVADGRGRRSACYKPNRKEVCFPLWARSRYVIIHEMAHMLQHRTSGDSAWHGTHFAGIVLGLVAELLGGDAYSRLKTEMLAGGVRAYCPLTKQTIC